MKNWKNHPKKLLRIGPDHFFPLTSQGHSPQPKIDFPYHEISGPDICSLICVFHALDFSAKRNPISAWIFATVIALKGRIEKFENPGRNFDTFEYSNLANFGPAENLQFNFDIHFTITYVKSVM